MTSFAGAALTALALGVALLGSSLGGAAAGQDLPSVEDIVDRANLTSYFRARDGRARAVMEIRDRQGRLRTRQITILRRDEPETDGLENGAYRGRQNYYVYFHRPADVNKMALVVWKYQDRDDDRWLYLPALDLVKRIAATDQRTSFAGSDFFYEDVSGRSIDADAHELIDVTENFYVLRNRPKEPGTVEFSYYDMFIHKGTYLPIQTEYYDKSDAKYRVYTALEVQTVQGYPTVTKARMQDLRTGSTTTISYDDVGYDVGLPENIFTERFLRRAPTEYLR
ncbi:MAG: outer membrane lipoprotein-sorting protein [Alphaproteobacteria bacterium]